MSLIVPNSQVSADSASIRNLLAFESIPNGANGKIELSQVVTQTALEAFECFRDTRLGCSHQIKKFTATVGTYCLVAAIPAGIACYLLKSLSENPSNYLSLPGMITAVPVLAVETVSRLTTGISPLRTMTKLTIGMLSAAVVYTAYKAGEATSAGYKQLELENAETRKFARDTVKEELTTTYNGIANQFLSLYNNAKDSVSDTLILQERADQLQDLIPRIKKELALLKLSSLELNLIFRGLTDAVKQVKESALNLRTPVSEDDNQYNVDILALSPSARSVNTNLPNEVKRNVEVAKTHTLGITHGIKSYASTFLSGIVTAAATGIAMPAALIGGTYLRTPEALDGCIASQDLSSCGLVLDFAKYAALPALVFGAIAAKRLHNNYNKIKATAAAKKETHEEKAFSTLSKIYDGVALNLQQRYRISPTDPKLQQDAARISQKLSSIKAQLAKTGLARTNEITAKLEEALNLF